MYNYKWYKKYIYKKRVIYFEKKAEETWFRSKPQGSHSEEMTFNQILTEIAEKEPQEEWVRGI